MGRKKQQPVATYAWTDNIIDGVIDQPQFGVGMAVSGYWDDLTGKDRPDKPWLNEAPRIILLSDADAGERPAVPGNVAFEFLKERVIERVGSERGRKHRWLLLTTRPDRMVEFAKWLKKKHDEVLRNNLWIGTVVTENDNLERVAQLVKVGDDRTRRFILVEGQAAKIGQGEYLGRLSWVIVRGNSPTDLESAGRLQDECAAAHIPIFMEIEGTPTEHQVRQMPEFGEKPLVPPPEPQPLIVPQAVREFRLFSEIGEQPTEWLWTNYLPLGELTVLEGDPGIGKSGVLLDIAARVSSGRPMPDGNHGAHGGVLLLAGEDSAEKTIHQRLRSAGAEMQRVAVMNRILSLPGDMAALEQAILQIRAKLIILDPITLYLGSTATNDQSVRKALTPLRELAERAKLAVVLVRHLTKSGGRNALYRGSGSIGIVAAIRSALLLAKSPDDPELRVLLQLKNNLGPIAPSLLFEPVQTDDRAVRIEWRGETDIRAEDLARSSGTRPTDKLDQARLFLWRQLSEGPMRQAEIEQRAVAEGVAKRTLERAKKALGIVSRREGFGPNSVILWEIPRQGEQ